MKIEFKAVSIETWPDKGLVHFSLGEGFIEIPRLQIPIILSLLAEAANELNRAALASGSLADVKEEAAPKCNEK